MVCICPLYFGALSWERKLIPAGEMAGGRVSFSDTTEYMSKIRVQFCGKVAPAGCTQHVFQLGRVKTCADQSTQLISRWMKMGTLLCRQMTRVYPVVSFTKLKLSRRDLENTTNSALKHKFNIFCEPEHPKNMQELLDKIHTVFTAASRTIMHCCCYQSW